MSQPDPYRRIASFYDRFVEPMQSGVRRAALQLVPPQPAWRVLDVGCGTGSGLLPYLEAGCEISGVDVSAAMLVQAAARLGERADLHLIAASGPLPSTDDQFDLTITSMVLHEVPVEDRREFLIEMSRVTKPEGRMLLVDFRFGPLRGWRGPLLRTATTVIERFAGHYSGFRSFRAAGGIPAALDEADLYLESEKIVAGGNMGIYVAHPAAGVA